MWLIMGFSQGIKGFLSFLAAPLLGALSDVHGRKTFLLLTVACTCIPIPFLLIHNLWWHVMAVAMSGACAVTFSIVFAYVSDVTNDHERSAAFGQVSVRVGGSTELGGVELNLPIAFHIGLSDICRLAGD